MCLARDLFNNMRVRGDGSAQQMLARGFKGLIIGGNMYNLIATAKRNADGTFDAEVSLTEYGDTTNKIISTTQQRTVSKNHATKERAVLASRTWIETRIYPVFRSLFVAKP